MNLEPPYLPKFKLNVTSSSYSFLILRETSDPEIIFIFKLDTKLPLILWNLRLNVLLIVLLGKLHSFSSCKTIFSKLLETEGGITDIIVTTENIAVIHLKTESVIWPRKLYSEDHSPVERGFSILTSPVRICLLWIFVVYKAANVNIRCPFDVKSFNVFCLPYYNSNLILLNKG